MEVRMTDNLDRELLFTETIPPYIPGTRFSSSAQTRGFVWGLRVAVMALIVLFAAALSIGTTSSIALVATLFGIFLVSMVSETMAVKLIKSATPIELFSDGIRMPTLYYERLLGLNGFIRHEDIDFIEILRKDIYQMMIFRNARGIKWLDAPVIMVVHLKNGKKLSSETKVPGQILAMAEILKNRFGIDVRDKGTGRGGMVRYENGKPVD
jgi:hypothetical protein